PPSETFRRSDGLLGGTRAGKWACTTLYGDERVLTEPTPPDVTTAPSAPRPEPMPLLPDVEMPPDGAGYRLKNKLLGPPLHTAQLEHDPLGRPSAPAAFASRDPQSA